MKSLIRSILLSTVVGAGLASAADIQPAIVEFNALHMAKAKPMFEALKNDEQHKNLANLYLARIELAAGRFAEARSYFDISLGIEPNSAEEHYWLAATCGALLTLPAGAENMDVFFCYFQNLDTAHSIDPRHVPTLLFYHQLSVSTSAAGGGSREKGWELLAELEKVSKADAAAARLYALNFDKESDKAMALAQSIVTDYPNSEKALLDAGKFLSNKRQYESAKTALKKAAELKITIDSRASIQNALYELGNIAWQTKTDIDNGIAALNRSIDSDVFPITGYTNWAYWRLSQLYKLKGDIAQQQKALAMLEKTGIEKAKLLAMEMSIK
jgi:tetratricopeptide (TPR) repeat protein